MGMWEKKGEGGGGIESIDRSGGLKAEQG